MKWIQSRTSFISPVEETGHENPIKRENISASVASRVKASYKAPFESTVARKKSFYQIWYWSEKTCKVMLLSAAWLPATTSQIDSGMNSASYLKCIPHCGMSFVMIIFDFACIWFIPLVGDLRWRQYSLQGTIRSSDACVFLAF